MFMRIVLVLLAFLASIAPAAAQNITANPEQIASVMRAADYEVTIEEGSDGNPYISSETSGYKFLVFFFGCDAMLPCASVQFYAGFTTEARPYDLEALNRWNTEKRFGRAYRDKDGDPVVEMDIDLEDGGMSRALFIDNLEYWDSIVRQFSEFAFEND